MSVPRAKVIISKSDILVDGKLMEGNVLTQRKISKYVRAYDRQIGRYQDQGAVCVKIIQIIQQNMIRIIILRSWKILCHVWWGNMLTLVGKLRKLI